MIGSDLATARLSSRDDFSELLSRVAETRRRLRRWARALEGELDGAAEAEGAAAPHGSHQRLASIAATLDNERAARSVAAEEDAASQRKTLRLSMVI